MAKSEITHCAGMCKYGLYLCIFLLLLLYLLLFYFYCYYICKIPIKSLFLIKPPMGESREMSTLVKNAKAKHLIGPLLQCE